MVNPAAIHSFNRYMAFTTGYGIAHKYAILWDGRIDTCIDGRSEMRSMLVGEKLEAFAVGVIMSPFLAPLWMLDSINRLDIYLSGKKPEHLGYGQKRTSKYDYVFT